MTIESVVVAVAAVTVAAEPAVQGRVGIGFLSILSM
jgi:hypothetical protein